MEGLDADDRGLIAPRVEADPSSAPFAADDGQVLGLVYDVDGALRLGSPRHQWRRVRGMVARSTRDRRSVSGMAHLVRELVTGRSDA